MTINRKSKQRQKTQEMLAILIGGTISLTVSVYSFSVGSYSFGLLFLAPVTFGIFWILAVEVETTCGVITKTTGRPCRNSAYGFLFGCSAPHHHLGKFLTRVGVQKRVSPRIKQAAKSDLGDTLYSPITNDVPSKATGPVLVKIEEDRKAKVAYWLMVATSAATVVSAATGLVTLHG